MSLYYHNITNITAIGTSACVPQTFFLIVSTVCMVYCHETGVYRLFDLHLWILSWLCGSNVALLINESYKMDDLMSVYLKISSFGCPDYMSVWTLISVMLLHPDHITLTAQSFCQVHKILSQSGVVCFCRCSVLSYCSLAKYFFQTQQVLHILWFNLKIMSNIKVHTAYRAESSSSLITLVHFQSS